MKLNRSIATLAGVLLAAAAHAQTQEAAKPQAGAGAHTSANSPAIGQAVSGHNSTAAGVSGTGLHTDGTASTGSAHTGVAEQAAGVDSKGRVTGKSTAVIGAAPGRADNVNAQATNTTAPNNRDPHPAATGGRGQSGDKAEQEIMKANARKVHEVPGDRMKTEAAARASRKKQAKARQKHAQKMAEHAEGGGS
jgi:hypothetical protein